MDQTTPFIYPEDEGSKLKPSSRYENFIGGDWQKPKSGKYFENISPTSGKVICEVLRSNAEDIDFALDAVHIKQLQLGEKLVLLKEQIFC